MTAAAVAMVATMLIASAIDGAHRHGVGTPAQKDGFARARDLLASIECTQAIGAMLNNTPWTNGTAGRAMTTILHAPNLRLVYVRNPKAASSSVVQVLRHLDPDANQRRERWVDYAWRKQWRARAPPKATFYFTFVREPIASFLSAYREVSLRWLKLRTNRPTVTRGPGASEAYGLDCVRSPTQRLAAFVRDVVSFNDLGYQAYHAWPQTVKIFVRAPAGRPTLDFVGRVEHFADDMLELLASVGVTNATRAELDEIRQNADKAHKSRCTAADREATEHVDSRTRAAIAAYVHADCVCLAPSYGGCRADMG